MGRRRSYSTDTFNLVYSFSQEYIAKIIMSNLLLVSTWKALIFSARYETKVPVLQLGWKNGTNNTNYVIFCNIIFSIGCRLYLYLKTYSARLEITLDWFIMRDEMDWDSLKAMVVRYFLNDWLYREILTTLLVYLYTRSFIIFSL